MKRDNGIKIKFIYDKWEHHSFYSGYPNLVKHLGIRLHPPDELSRRSRLIPWRIANFFVFTHAGMKHYSHHYFYYELSAFLDMLHNHHVIYHFLEGDFSYRYLGLFNRFRHNNVVATYNCPPEELSPIMTERKHLRRLSAIILVGKNQIPFFEPYVQSDRLHWVPLGVDTNFFHPNQNRIYNKTKKCLFVGRHLRDLDTLKQVVKRIADDQFDVETIIVTDKESASAFAGINRVTIRLSISDLELLNLYQTVDLLLLPLINATAVSTLLESLACGLPAVVTKVGGVPDYVDSSCAVLVPPKDPEAMYIAVRKILSDDERRKELARNARQRALQFDWSNIAQQMLDIYQKIKS
jgi:glycosyltransferase involved in cell wall biosynthesis